MEPRFNEGAGDRPNLFVKWRVRYIEVLFHTFYCNFGRDIEIISFVISRTSLNRGSLNRGSTVSSFLSMANYRKLQAERAGDPIGPTVPLGLADKQTYVVYFCVNTFIISISK